MELSELIRAYYQKQSPRGVPRKRCSENMLQIYRTTPMPKCDFNKVALGGVGGGGVPNVCIMLKNLMQC